MSVSSVSSKPIDIPTVYVGNSEILERIERIVSPYKPTVRFQLDSLSRDPREIVFGRDSRVIGADDVHLIPYPIKDPFLTGRFKSLLPISSDPMICSMRAEHGEGFSLSNVKAAIDFAKKMDVPFTQLSCCIEGGNCFVFADSNKTTKAIVGIHSVILTLIALEEQGLFSEEALKEAEEIVKSPSDDAIRMARNEKLYAPKRDYDQRFASFAAARKEMEFGKSCELLKEFRDELRKKWGGEQKFLASLQTPLTENEKEEHRNKGLKFEAKLYLSKKAIAKDLQIPLENIAFVPQTAFHIDMDMFVSPRGDVYLDKNSQRAAEPIEKIGCKVTLVPGVHVKDNVNFMNGSFIPTEKGPIFVTNGADDRNLKLAEIFQYATAPLHVQFVPGMEEVIRSNFGGIHCTTWEQSSSKKSDHKRDEKKGN